tara:strand:+ start:920 stop:1120 length:201 start_codon:yes stop_codon:yes gene_type:complete
MELTDKQISKKKYNDKYYELNKKNILDKIRKKVICETCNCLINKSGISKHNKTKKHVNKLEKRFKN